MGKKQSQEEKEQAIFNSNVREVMKTRQGKDFIWAILERCYIYTPKFTGHKQTTGHLVGRESVGIEILEMLTEADPTIYPRLLLEHVPEQETNETENDNDHTNTD